MSQHLIAHAPVRGFAPLRGFVSLSDEFDALVRDVLGGWDAGRTAAGWMPAADVEETDEAYVVTADVPGMTRKDLTVTLQENTLTIHGTRRNPRPGGQPGPRRAERVEGEFTRQFGLPRTVDPDGVKADVRDGVLTVTLPKRAGAKPRQITVGGD